MEIITEQKSMDMILEYLIENIGKSILSYEICEKVFPNTDKVLVYSCITKIIEENNNIVIVDKDTLDISLDSFYCYLEATKLTEIFFYKDGGFTELYKKREIVKNKENELKKLQVENLKLQNENLKYSETIREKEAKIRDLEFKIKRIELLKQYWWVILACIFLGGLLKEFLDRIIAYMQ